MYYICELKTHSNKKKVAPHKHPTPTLHDGSHRHFSKFSCQFRLNALALAVCVIMKNIFIHIYI